ncbi:MAG: hypothetical protein IR160_00765 [Salinibacterium sp.]|nr:hypothetical protein [Salinibacterium sp.]MBF0671099.1 hypothetical protein [Salinibacterium sp.]
MIVMLTLTSTVTHAAWTAGSSTISSASTSSLGSLTVNGTDLLGGQSLSASAPGKLAPLTVSTQGSAPLALTSLQIVSSGDASMMQSVALKLWKQSGGSCATVPGTTINTTLAATAPVDVSGLAVTVLAGTPATLCAQTQLTSPSAHSGKAITSALVFSAKVPGSTSWVANSAAVSFTQRVAIGAPTVTCTDNGGFFGSPGFNLTWSMVDGATYRAEWRRSTTSGWTTTPAAGSIASGQSFTSQSGDIEIGDGVRQIRVVAQLDGVTVVSNTVTLTDKWYAIIGTTPRCA